MKRFGIALLSVFMLASFVQAAVLYVDDDPTNTISYRSLESAHNAAEPGDTIYVNGQRLGGGSESFGIDREVHIIGAGYLMGENPDASFDAPSEFNLGNLSFREGSSNSTVEGITVSSIIIYSNIQNLVFERIKATDITVNSANTEFIQCFITRDLRFTYYSSNGEVYNTIAKNFFVEDGTGIVTAAYNTFSKFDVNRTDIHNCVLYGDVANVEGNECSIYNNVFVTEFTSGTDNITSEYHTLFVSGYGLNWDGSTDGFYVPVDGAASFGAGVGGTDCGAFSGPAPYVLSGYTTLPRVLEFTAPMYAKPTSGIPVQIRATVQD